MKKYFLGLDIGTNSCGWAVTDEEFNILRAKGKHGHKMWGVRLFEEASTAAERRVKRTNRRRLDRRKLKIMWLNEIFAPQLSKVDPKFLERLKYSALFEDDKEKFGLKSANSLFNDENFKDADFYKKYPTIYHLRRELLSKPAEDIRFLYLALHNIIKRRGHFLYDIDFGGGEGALEEDINLAICNIKEFYGEDNENFTLNEISKNQAEELVKELKKKQGKKATKEAFKKLLCASKNADKAFAEALVDGVVKVADIFGEKDAEKIDLNADDAEGKIYEIAGAIGESAVSAIQHISKVYSQLQLKLLLGDNNFICDAMVEKFEIHQAQLKDFKTFIKKYYPKEYFNIFRNKDNEKIGYSQYIKNTLVDGKKQVVDLNIKDARNVDSFYDYIKKILEQNPEVQDEKFENKKAEILHLIELKEFLPKPRAKTNGALPNSLYVAEAKKILEVNAQKFEFLNQKYDKHNLTNADKILEILKFRVPYYVGPIGKNSNGQKHWWAERNAGMETEDYKPWTLKDIVDFDAAEEAFINNMTNKCTYLPEEEVLPKNSILFAKFKVLNELNNLKIDGKAIPVVLKQKIFNELFMRKTKVTTKMLKEFLIDEGQIDEEKEVVISGIDKEFANNMAVYHKFATTKNNVFTKDFVDENLEKFEEIIKLHTIMSDKDRVVNRIKKEYPNVFSEPQLKYIKGLNFAGWGSLSAKFLTGLVFKNIETETSTTVLNELWNTNKNLQQIVTDGNYTLSEVLVKRKEKTIETLVYEDVQNLYCSPAVKRGVWQAIQIVKEIAKVMGGAPEKVFVEVTRHDEEKGDAGRKNSRQKLLQEKLDAVKKSAFLTADEYNKIKKELAEKDNSKLRSESLFLYFMQCGKCAYSGQKLNIDALSTECDIDHIIPQSIIKDDSIDNKVLVLKQYNRDKENTYPIYSKFPQWVAARKDFWTFLLNNKFISQSKYDRLVRTEELSDDELGGFIARQIVETNQSAKAVIDLLKSCLDNPRNVVFSKAKLVSEFRHPVVADIPKTRATNDLHHAVDAYLNIVVGDIVHERFTDDPRNFYKKDHHNKDVSKNLRFMFKHTIRNQNTGKAVWHGQTSINDVRKNCLRNDMLVSRMSYQDLFNAFYDETIYKSAKNDAKTKASVVLKGAEDNPLKDISKYGGYNSQKNAFFLAIKSEDKKGNPQITIEAVPTLAVRQFYGKPNFDENILNYVAKENNLINPKLISKVNFKSTLKLGKGEYWLGGKTGSNYVLHNGNQWYTDYDTTKYIKTIEKYLQMKAKKTHVNLERNENEIIVVQPNKKGENAQVISKSKNQWLYNQVILQLKKEIYLSTTMGNDFLQAVIDKQIAFSELDKETQIDVLMGLIKRIKTGATNADLKKMNEKATGKVYLGKNITDKNIYLVKRSVTGLFEKKVRLS